MKHTLVRTLALVTVLLTLLCGAALADRGDINGDGVMDEVDAQVLRLHLVGDIEEIGDADFNFDGKVNLRDLVLLEKAIYEGEALPDEPTDEGSITRTDVVYGTSYKKRDLVCTIISPERYERTVLAVFALHGFEGGWNNDGQLLVYTANRIIEHFEAMGSLNGTRLMVVAAANPDGVWNGNSAEVFGYGNARGINLDRDFGEEHKSSNKKGDYSKSAYSAPESKALRDLVLQYKPDVVLDFHGWSDECSGDAWLADVFKEEMSKSHVSNFDSKNNYGNFTLWTHAQGIDSLKVHLKTSEAEGEEILNAMNRIVLGDYDSDGEGDYSYEPALANLGEYACYADDYRQLRMYADIGGKQIGYIDAEEDLCVIEAVYACGWVRVRYPIKEGYKVGYCDMENFFVPDTLINPIQMKMPQELRVYTRSRYFTDEYKTYVQRYKVRTKNNIIINQGPIYTKNETTGQLTTKSIEGRSIGAIAKGRTVTVVAESDEAYQVIYPWKDEGYRMGWITSDKFDLPEIPTAAAKAEKETEEVEASVPTPIMDTRVLTGKLSVDGLKINVGEEFDLPIFLDANAISSLLLTVEYSPEVFDLVSVFDGGLLKGFTGSMDMESGEYRAVWNNQGDIPVDGLLINLRFYTKPIGKDTQVRMSYKLHKGDALTHDLEVVDVK